MAAAQSTRSPGSRPAGSSWRAPVAYALRGRLRAGAQGRQAAVGDPRPVAYDLEYGAATSRCTPTRSPPGERVLLVDDVLATGGTAARGAVLVRRTGADVVGLAVLIELAFLPGRDRLPGVDVFALLAV